MSDAAHQTWKPRFNPWLIAIVVTMAAFMEILDTTIVNVALPYIAGSLATSSDNASYALTAYLVANGIVLTVAGWISDTVGRKRYFVICIIMFTVTSFLCGIAQSLGQIVLFRAMQGFFGGGLQPNQQAIILDTFPPAKRAAAFGITAIATIIAPILGPTLGGYIVNHSTWRWIFFVNIPVGALAAFLNSVMVEDPPWEKEKREKKTRGIDYIGLSLIVLGLGCMQIMIDRGEDDGWFGSPFIVTMGVLAFIGIFGAICWLLTAKQPIINLDVFKDRNFAMGSVLIGAMGAILYASAVLIPQLAQQQLGYDALWSGLILSPGGIVIILLIPVVGRISKVVPTRYIVMTGFFIMGCALMFSGRLIVNINFKTLVEMRSFQTAALGFLFVPISTIAYLTLPMRYRSDGAALFSMFRNVGGAIGISLAQAAVIERSQANQAHLSRFMSPLQQGYNTYVQSAEQTLRTLGRAASTVHDDAVGQLYTSYRTQAAILAYNNVFQYAAVVAFLVVPLCFLISNKKAQGGGGGGH
ncbi:DHA2 family efflux MFS transporter permease subunit [Lichenihabitans sp. Uapishka_5]|uniref:DHA2 family efflux MFS transporter permease subunit n=1 Tax=Lichenihabitans sp. Uapishka_5 TaxID=3037302 RepID=UPI0029E7EAF3|nr:DHA2 family efflux MFS transporter permease subunit [Lichenihabitans sp. Uapishka_5]MDX7952020.1 DHA2 family efflux MFS transporter permease subunit [Lichenihabitans sp. Uapishka_5]